MGLTSIPLGLRRRAASALYRVGFELLGVGLALQPPVAGARLVKVHVAAGWSVPLATVASGTERAGEAVA